MNLNLITTDRLFARIESELSTYQANNILDTEVFFSQVKWFMQQLGRAVEPYEEVVVKLDNYRVELPCDFYSLDSAWLCDRNGSSYQWNQQSKYIAYTEEICETVGNNAPCGRVDGQMAISACNMEKVYNKSTIKEYIATSNPDIFTWNMPTLLRITPKKSVENICSKDCKSIFSTSPDEISIKKQGNSLILFSTLKDPIIYLKYYAYPIDKETGLPLMPDHSVFEEALFYHCITYFLRMAWLNKMVVDIEKQLQYFEAIARDKFSQAMRLSKLPSFDKAVQLGRRSREKFSSYEVMNNKHY